VKRRSKRHHPRGTKRRGAQSVLNPSTPSSLIRGRVCAGSLECCLSAGAKGDIGEGEGRPRHTDSGGRGFRSWSWMLSITVDVCCRLQKQNNQMVLRWGERGLGSWADSCKR
jgi:hypothetical protein